MNFTSLIIILAFPTTSKASPVQIHCRDLIIHLIFTMTQKERHFPFLHGGSSLKRLPNVPWLCIRYAKEPPHHSHPHHGANSIKRIVQMCTILYQDPLHQEV